MTLTETRPPETPAAASESPVLLPETWLTTSDHKRLGRLYVVAALLFALAGGAAGLALEVSRASSGGGTSLEVYTRLFSLHSTVTSLLFLGPLWVGLATYLVPLQIGARRLAFPRVQALAFWSYVGGGALLLASYLRHPIGAGIVFGAPLPVSPNGSNHSTDLWIGALMLVTAASVLAAANLFVTVLKLRCEGMTMLRVPAFTWSVLATSAATVLAGPIFVAGLLLLYLDQHFGGHLFDPAQVNANAVWQHMLWLYGRPDAYLIFLPALGVVSDVVAAHARRPLFQATVVKVAIFAFAVLSFGILAAPGGTSATAALLPFPTVVSALVVLPAGLCLLLWLGTIRPPELRLHVSLLYVAGFVLLCLLGGANALIGAIRGVPAGSAWATGQMHAVLVGAPVLAAFAGLYHWAPKIWGRHLRGLGGVVQWLLLFGGFVIMAGADWLLGYDGAPWHIATVTGPGTHSGWISLTRGEAAGGALIALGLLVFLANLAVSVLGGGPPAEDDPYEAATLEWATSSPPPEDNFAYVPEVRSDRPLADLRASAAGGA